VRGENRREKKIKMPLNGHNRVAKSKNRFAALRRTPFKCGPQESLVQVGIPAEKMPLA